MQSANILLALGGDSGNQVPKYHVTAAEIAVLRAIHGDESVSEIEPVPAKSADPDVANRTNRAELARLKAVYGNARDADGNIVVETLFPGVAARVYENLDELGLDKSLFAAKQRVSAEDFGGKGDHDGDGKTGGAAKPKAEGLSALSVPDLRKLAEDKKVDLGSATKKADILAKLEAAGVTLEDEEEVDEDEEDEDDVADMNDGSDVLG